MEQGEAEAHVAAEASKLRSEVEAKLAAAEGRVREFSEKLEASEVTCAPSLKPPPC